MTGSFFLNKTVPSRVAGLPLHLVNKPEGVTGLKRPNLTIWGRRKMGVVDEEGGGGRRLGECIK